MIKKQITGIGSLPFKTVDAALALIFEYMPHGPHWPQLPKKSSQEGFAHQYLQPLFAMGMLTMEENRELRFRDDEKDWTEKLTNFYQMYLDFEAAQKDKQYLDPFAFPEQSASGFYGFSGKDFSNLLSRPLFVKGQVSGPVTIGLQVVAADGASAFYKDDLRDVLVKTLALNALWQVKMLQQKKLPVLLFIDEPGLIAYGQSTTVALSRAVIGEAINEIIEPLKRAGALVGVHCCAGVDWSILFEQPIDVVAFDAFDYFDSLLVYTGSLTDYLHKGGTLGWGIVPTSDKIEEHDGESLYRLWQKHITTLVQKGVPESLLKENYLLTPSCGAGTMREEQAAQVYKTACSLHKLITSS